VHIVLSIYFLFIFLCYHSQLNGHFFHFGVKQVLSEWAKDLISDSPAVFGETFSHVFGQQMVGHLFIFH
jgi:hypothetical protein